MCMHSPKHFPRLPKVPNCTPRHSTVPFSHVIRLRSTTTILTIQSRLHRRVAPPLLATHGQGTFSDIEDYTKDYM